ncbi:bifunctional phosphatase PAP2/diacylglycerol kinase family protein [Gordonia aichiensis]|nr:diacylglycerol kinase family protein [Gordonia aichiensis]
MTRQRHLGRRRTEPLHELTKGLGTLDANLFQTIARSPSPLLDRTMPPLTAAADHSKLWMGIGAGLILSGRPRWQRAAVRGLASLAVTSLVTNQGAKRIRQRERPSPSVVPLLRRGSHQPTSNSLPSGHSASAAAFSVGVALESPPLGLIMSALAGLVGLSRVATGAHYPGDVFIGFGIGAGIATIGGKIVPPIIPHNIATPAPSTVAAPLPRDGAGLVVLGNPTSGDGNSEHILERVRTELTGAEIIELGPDDDYAAIARDAARRATALGVCGGDGTVATVAAAAHEADLPLAVFPGGTFNHFARDIGCGDVDASLARIRSGTATLVDAAILNDEQLILNTASIGAYPHFVRARTKWEHRVGKTAASALAMVQVARHSTPVEITIDGRTVTTSLFLIGTSMYSSAGFAPGRRERLDDGLLDVRFLEAGKRFATLRVLTSLATGLLQRSRLYTEMQVPEFTFTSTEPVTIAHDGEVGESYTSARFRAGYRTLKVYGDSIVAD